MPNSAGDQESNFEAIVWNPSFERCKVGERSAGKTPRNTFKGKNSSILGKKVFQHSRRRLVVFPSIETLNQVAAEEVDEDDLTAAEIARKKDAETRGKGAKRKAAESLSNLQSTIRPKPGRPRKAVQPVVGQNSILKFFQQEKNQS